MVCELDCREAILLPNVHVGSPVRIGPNLLVHNDPDIVRHLNAPGSRWRRSEWYEAMKLDPRTDTVFSTRDEKVHADLKAKEAGGVGQEPTCSLKQL